MRRNQVAWWLWAVGFVLIALSWFGVVSLKVGWIGFAIGAFASVLSWGIRPPRSAVSSGTTDDHDEHQAPKV
jgi:hypothetical protein